jgi:ABC-type phosphate/phosphonate transport system substrate-binding protein
MNAERIAALPMYDFPDVAAAHDALWSALAARLRAAGIGDIPSTLTRTLGHTDTWRHPRLLLGQACEYPLAKGYSRYVRLVATPRYTAPGCEGARYRSAIVVRRDDHAATLADLRNRRCAVNEADSNSGMNLLRAALAPIALGPRFFESVAISGSHRSSIAMIAAGGADVAAVDCVSYAHFQRSLPEITAGLRILAWSAPSPCLSLITASSTDDATLAALRRALAAVNADAALAPVRERLFLNGFDFEPDGTFAEVLSHERAAEACGYPELR